MPRRCIVGSAFRNAVHYLPRYFTQVAALQQALLKSFQVSVVAVEGDSADNTYFELQRVASAFGVDCAVVEHQTGKRHFGSTEEPERMRALSGVGNAILDSAATLLSDGDILVYVESDLLWDARTIMQLITQLTDNDDGYSSVSPLTMAGAAFYDVWAFRGLDGRRWSPHFPYHMDADHTPGALTEVASVGSCLVMTGELARSSARMTDGALVEFCTTARSLGYRFAVNASLRINHP